MLIRKANEQDLSDILRIYNQGIEDRVATLETQPKDAAYIQAWFAGRKPRYAVLVAEIDGEIAGWASINAYNPRAAYDGVGELSIYVRRSRRGQGVGKQLLAALEQIGREERFHKFVLFTFPFNPLAQDLYRRAGYRAVGTFRNQGLLDGQFVDVMAMEKVF